MQHVQDDPELAQEMVQLLGKELKALRRRIRDLEQYRANTEVTERENVTLREEVASLRSQLARSLNPPASLEDSGDTRLKEMLNKQKQKQKNKASEDVLQSEVKDMLRKNQELEDRNCQLAADLDSLRGTIENITAEKTALAKSLEKVQNFDLAGFLQNPSCPLNYVNPPSDAPEALPPYKRLAFDTAVKASGGKGTWGYTDHDLLWSSKGVGHCVYPSPTYIFEPKSTAMKPISIHQKVGDVKDLFCANKHFSKYYGTYQCTHVTTVNFATLSKVDKTLADGLLKRLISDKKMVPPIISEFVERLYVSGVLKFHCVVFQCVGYNHDVYREITTLEPAVSVKANHSNSGKGNNSAKRIKESGELSDSNHRVIKKPRHSD